MCVFICTLLNIVTILLQTVFSICVYIYIYIHIRIEFEILKECSMPFTAELLIMKCGFIIISRWTSVWFSGHPWSIVEARLFITGSKAVSSRNWSNLCDATGCTVKTSYSALYTCTSGDVSINYARDNVSAINVCDPFLQPTAISYRCNCNIIRYKRIGADKSGFFKIVSNGLRSVSTVMCFPIV